MSSYLQEKLQDYFPKYSSFWKAAYEMYADIEEMLKNNPKRPLFIGVMGGAGSGKTTFCTMMDFLLEAHDEKGLVLCSDDFYFSEEERSAKGIKWRGSPESHDLKKLEAVINSLGQKKVPLDVPVFDHSIDASGAPHRLEKMPSVIFFEGWMVGALLDNIYGDYKRVLDKTIYLDMSLEDMKHRRCGREADIFEKTGKGFSPETMEAFWNEGIVPTYKQYVAPYRKKADRVYGFEIEEGADLKYI